MSMRYNMDIVDYNDYAISNINEDNRYDKYDVLRKVMYHYSLYYLLVVNTLTFLLYGIDKYKAKKARWRISEATLLMMAVIGGSIGAWAGMRLWHHKTMHKKFKYGIPLIILLQVVLVFYLHNLK